MSFTIGMGSFLLSLIVSGIFTYFSSAQDFKMFAFSIKENIVLDNKNNITSETISSLLDEVGLGQKLRELPYGLETSVYKEFDENGFEPSPTIANFVPDLISILRFFIA